MEGRLIILLPRFAVIEASVIEITVHPAVVAHPITGILIFVVMDFCRQEMMTLLVVVVFLIIAMHKYAVIIPSV